MQQMMGNQNPQQMYNMQRQMTQLESAMLFGNRVFATPDVPQGRAPKKKCVCAYCGRPAKITQEDACKGCGAWEVEFK